MSEQLDGALGRGDAAGIRQILSADSKGHITPGFPLGAGGDHAGADAMMERVWWAIGASLRARRVADEYRLLDDGRLFVRGHYLGQARGRGARLDADSFIS